MDESTEEKHTHIQQRLLLSLRDDNTGDDWDCTLFLEFEARLQR